MRHGTVFSAPARLTGVGCSASLALALTAAGAVALPTYEIAPLGFTDPEHTRNDGNQDSSLIRVTESGYVTGSSRRFNGGAASLGSSVWIYDASDGSTTRLGYTDVGHTGSNGFRFSHATGLTESGYAAGYSDRYNGAAWHGDSAWIYDASDGSTTQLGYTDAAHTRSDGLRVSHPDRLTESGFAAGFSRRFNGATSSGDSLWIYDADDDSTMPLGLTDAAHTRNDGYRISRLRNLTNSGYATGSSERFNGGATLRGQSAWIYDASDGSTTTLGYTDAAHTRTDGYRESSPEFLTESGLFAGSSRRYNGAAENGRSTWIYDASDGSTTTLGYTDAAHTGSDGRRETYTLELVDSGRAIGYSLRYSGVTFHGYSAWLYDANDHSTTPIGYTDAAHTRSDGHRESHPDFLTASGYVAGRSDRYNGGATYLGESAWLYKTSDGSTAPLGFTDANHTRSDGWRESNTYLLTESGHAAGHSKRYDGGATYLGESAWVYDASDGTTTQVGHIDATHTRSDGYRASWVDMAAESGWVAGYSERYNGGATYLGESAWIYDGSGDSHYGVILSERSDGYASSVVSFLGDDGFALGGYELFDVDDSSLGYRAFAWTPEDGAVDLGSLVAGGLTAEGWAFLADAIRANGLGQIVGSGRLATGGDLAYLLVPIPEPGTGLLLAVGLLGLVARKRLARTG